MGTPGQDGYGRISVRPGSEVGQSARSALATMPGQQTAQVGNGLTVTGSQDAINRLAAPVGNVDYNSPTYQRYVADNQAKEAYVNREQSPLASNVPQPPKYMSKEEGMAQGLGWKGRLAKYQTDVETYNKATGNKNAMDIEAMREAGAGNRALLQAQGVNDQNAIAKQRLGGELALNQANIDAKDVEQQKGQFEIEALRTAQQARDEYIKNPTPENEQKYRGAIGKFEKEAQYGTVGEYDDQGMKTGERLYNKQTGMPGPDVGSRQVQAPQAALDFLKKNPGQAQAFKQKYGYIPQGF